MRALADWSRAGVRRVDGSPLRGDGQAGLLMPDGAGGDAFVVYPNFSAVRKYNASDYYVLSVGLIGDRVTA
jgi:membrane-bound lytic murein transglycosylase B